PKELQNAHQTPNAVGHHQHKIVLRWGISLGLWPTAQGSVTARLRSDRVTVYSVTTTTNGDRQISLARPLPQTGVRSGLLRGCSPSSCRLVFCFHPPLGLD
ncbi:unnamed protein product, partial [Ectocarpus sp. 13 AM-2016]